MVADYTAQIKENLLELGADLIGVAGVDALKGLKANPHDLLTPFTKTLCRMPHGLPLQKNGHRQRTDSTCISGDKH